MTHDPNSRDARRYRRAQLAAAYKPAVRSRLEYISQRTRGRRVLDVGCVDQVASGYELGPLHRKLALSASEILGIDINADGVAALREEGFSVRVADVSAPRLEDHVGLGYDVVVAGEIIEHLLDLGSFFLNAWRVLAPGGLLVLTTPNPYAPYLALHNLAGRPADNADHTLYHWPSGIAEIADRTDFVVTEIRGERWIPAQKHNVPFGMLGWAVSRLAPRSYAECNTMIYLLRKRNPFERASHPDA